jgi:hypothetical protein
MRKPGFVSCPTRELCSVVIDGTKARLFAHGAAQPCLIVKDMKFGDSESAVALFVGPGTEGYFANLKITSNSRANRK